ncbi:MAG: DNA polymerase III subunit beta [Clostridiales bacterium]|nr:DNA polymerase III subunit beta [Clostridiales bacterium]
MKFICNPTEFSDALAIVSKALPAKATTPILEGIKISVDTDTVTLSATDVDLFVEKKIKARVLLEGETVVPGRFFTDFIKKLTDLNEIEIEKFDKDLKILYNGNETVIKPFDEDTFPEFRDGDELNSFSVKQRDLRDLLDRTIFCVAVDETRPILKGCLLHLKGEELTAVALDGYRLAICKCPVVLGEGTAKVVLPGKNLNEISKILEDTDDVVRVSIQKNLVKFELEHTKISTRLIEGDFIAYESIIPKDPIGVVTINKEMFEKGLDRASLIARKRKNNYVKLDINENTMNISSEAESMKISETVPCKLNGNNIVIAFNSKYLFDAFAKISEDYITINFVSANAPATITPIEGDKYKYVVLPVRLAM